MVRRHSWDDPAPPEGEPHQGRGGPPPPPEEADDEEREEQRAEAGVCLAELLLELHVEGRLTAKAVCGISYWAAKAGARGPVKDLAFRPNAPSGHFQRHLDHIAGLRGSHSDFVTLQVPGHSKHSCDRAVHEVRVLAPHECLHKEVAEDPSILEKVVPAEWPPSFRSHPVVQQAPVGTVVPLAFYMDAAQYTKGGAAVVVFVVCNLLSGLRHLVAVLKKKEFCRCGCRGWCSLRPVFAFLNWSFQALAMGSFPGAGPAGTPWPSSDARRRSLAGLPLCLRGAVVQVKGDWAEYSHSLGFPTWRHTDYPCLWCRCDRETLYDWVDMVPGELPWMLNGADDYEDACSRCERHVVIQTEALRDLIASNLFYDKRVLGSRGRSLKTDIRQLGLLAGDRLEPSTGCPDIGAFEHLPVPATVLFWRPSEESMSKHQNPLFNTITGIALEILTVDTLHCLYLGVLQVHCSRVLWALIEADAWNVRESGDTTMPARVQESCTRLQHALGIWCRRTAGATNVQDINPYVLGGTKEEQKLGLKGGETKSMFLFLHEFLPLHAATVAGATHMLDASRALLRHLELLKEGPRRFSANQEKDPEIPKGCTPTPWTYIAMLSLLRFCCFPLCS